MLMQLADFLSQYESGFNVFQYITMRAILGVLTALLISFLVGPWMIRHLSIRQIGQTARKEIERMLGVKVHLELFVRVQKNWTMSGRMMKEFGYE